MSRRDYYHLDRRRRPGNWGKSGSSLPGSRAFMDRSSRDARTVEEVNLPRAVPRQDGSEIDDSDRD